MSCVPRHGELLMSAGWMIVFLRTHITTLLLTVLMEANIGIRICSHLSVILGLVDSKWEVRSWDVSFRLDLEKGYTSF
jgi:hypothetical protein